MAENDAHSAATAKAIFLDLFTGKLRYGYLVVVNGWFNKVANSNIESSGAVICKVRFRFQSQRFALLLDLRIEKQVRRVGALPHKTL